MSAPETGRVAPRVATSAGLVALRHGEGDECRWVVDDEIGRFFLPGCMGAAVYGLRGCTCGNRVSARAKREQRIAELEERVSALEKLIAAQGQQGEG